MTVNRFDQLLEHWDSRLRKAFLEAMRNIKDQVIIDDVVRMLQRDDADGALKAVGLDPALLRVWNIAFEQAFEAGGVATANGIPARLLDVGYRLKFQFDVKNPLAELWLKRLSSSFVTAVLEDQRQMIRDVLEDGMSRGLNPRSVALDLVGRIDERGIRSGGKIGLTRTQAQWVRDFQTELVSKPAAALQRNLRDKRFDPIIRRAITNGEPVPFETIRKMVITYENRALRHRAETIARTEAMSALHQSQETAIEIAVQKGAVDRDRVGFVWRTARDKRVRDTHRSMNGQSRSMGQRFVTGSGAHLRFPGDPEGPAGEIINCRCWREPKIDFLRGIT